MSERNQSRPNRVLPGLLSAASVALGGTVVALVVRPDLYYSSINQIDNPLEPTQPTVVATAPTIPGPSNTPTPTERLGKGRGKTPVSFEWQLGNLNMATDVIQSKDSIFDEPNGSHALAWTRTMMGACAASGNVGIGLHSGFELDSATIPPNIIRRLGKDGIGSVIVLKAADGTTCKYTVESYGSVKKFGDGPGTYIDVLENIPTGYDVRDPEVRAGLWLTSCDEDAGWDSERHTSVNNAWVHAWLTDVVPAGYEHPKK